jgi:hypothetical protein
VVVVVVPASPFAVGLETLVGLLVVVLGPMGAEEAWVLLTHVLRDEDG